MAKPTLCEFCQETVAPSSHRTVQRVTGWERRRDQGGTNALMLRQPMAVYAHLECVQKLAKGVHPDQGMLL